MTSRRRWALMHELRDEGEPDLAETLQHLTPVDLVLVEGFKHESHPKLQVIAPGAVDKPLPEAIQGLQAFACENPELAPAFTAGKPVLSRNDISGIADLVIASALSWP